jgi:hypothetical protein
MDITIQIPDELARDLAKTGADLSRRALEAFALEEYKVRHLSRPAMRKLLGFETRDQLEDFLKAHAVVVDVAETSLPEFENLSDFLLHSPFAGANLDLERPKDHPRSIELE